MRMLSTTYTLWLPDGSKVAIGPDQSAEGWAGHLHELTTKVDYEQAVGARSGQDGAYIGDTFAGKRSTVITARVIEYDPNIRGQRLNALGRATTMRRADGWLRWIEDDGIERELTVRLSDLDGPIHEGGGSVAKQVKLYLASADPRILSSQQWMTPWLSAGQTAELPQSGNAESHPLIRILGPATSATVVMSDVTGTIELGRMVVNLAAAPLLNDETLVINADPRVREVSRDGAVSLRRYVDWAVSSYPVIPAGGCRLTFAAGGSAPHTALSVVYPFAWEV